MAPRWPPWLPSIRGTGLGAPIHVLDVERCVVGRAGATGSRRTEVLGAGDDRVSRVGGCSPATLRMHLARGGGEV